MKLSSRSALALLLGTALAGSLSSCDYQWTPGDNAQFRHGFNNAPGWHKVDVNRDSINYKQETNPAAGVGSAAAIATGTVQEQIDSAPAGRSAAAGQSASGTMAPVGKATTGNGVKTDQPQTKPQPK
ncbi:hypothetical protein I2I05_20175 [Hymenobacter sp. BT683]|uniref:Lipoprotein n=1 Tax=Hymenobacter jeongseonensis TaxID=2791027 RepID=A0ABS0IMZ4_9BACT|nr:hypothetical protein [Hymenobacter jeongseonensis]MBF9239721.1 hypothetical protein [Hymenobacter jeongseonensis]